MSFVHDFRRLSPSQRHTFIAAFLGWTLDSLDFFLLIFCVKAISADFHAKPSDVLGAVFLTQAFRPIGALLFGVLADRYGRRPVLMFNILSFSVIELACAFAPSINSVVATPTVGMPRASSSAMSCVQHDMQDPQSLSPSMTRLTSVAICCCSGSGAGRVLVGFL